MQCKGRILQLGAGQRPSRAYHTGQPSSGFSSGLRPSAPSGSPQEPYVVAPRNLQNSLGLKFGKPLGSGAFGKVYAGVLAACCPELLILHVFMTFSRAHPHAVPCAVCKIGHAEPGLNQFLRHRPQAAITAAV